MTGLYHSESGILRESRDPTGTQPEPSLPQGVQFGSLASLYY